MKYLYTLILASVLPLASGNLDAQAFMGFENRTTTLNSTSTSGQYVDLGDATVAHELLDYTAGAVNVPVSSPTSPGVLGFRSFFTPSRTGALTSTEGLTEGDIFGYATGAAVSGSVAQGPTEGANAFMVEDTDGTVTLEFSPVDLANQTGILFTMDFIVDGSFESGNGANDRVYVGIEVTDCAAAGSVPFFDSDGGGIGGGGGMDLENAIYNGVTIMDGTWYTIAEDLSAFSACKVQLIIEADFNSTTEEAAFDNISFSAGQTLPVEFLNFTAAPREKAVDLAWATATETENRGFSIERSMDATNFQPIGWIEGNENAGALNRYTFTDDTVDPGQQYFYRLRQEDFGGAYTYSSIATVLTPGAAASSVGRLYPNPAQQGLTHLELTPKERGKWVITLLDLSGKVISSTPHNLAEGQQLIPVNLQQQPPGTYLVKITGDETTQLRRIVR